MLSNSELKADRSSPASKNTDTGPSSSWASSQPSSSQRVSSATTGTSTSIELSAESLSSSSASMQQETYSRWSQFVCSLFTPLPHHHQKLTTQPVFQPKLDILGMVIYATEFVLWCGVFACGGYFNLRPWIKQKLRARREGQGSSEGPTVEGGESGVSNDVSLHQVPSSTSVFRTPSSVVASRSSVRLETVG